MQVGGAGYPAFTAINFRKKRFTTAATAFSEKSLKEFVNVLIAGRQATVPLEADVVAALQEHAPWDGKDGELQAVDEIDLADLLNDEL